MGSRKFYKNLVPDKCFLKFLSQIILKIFLQFLLFHFKSWPNSKRLNVASKSQEMFTNVSNFRKDSAHNMISYLQHMHI